MTSLGPTSCQPRGMDNGVLDRVLDTLAGFDTWIIGPTNAAP